MQCCDSQPRHEDSMKKDCMYVLKTLSAAVIGLQELTAKQMLTHQPECSSLLPTMGQSQAITGPLHVNFWATTGPIQGYYRATTGSLMGHNRAAMGPYNLQHQRTTGVLSHLHNLQHQRTTGSVSSPQSVSEDYRKCLIFTISIRRLKGVSHFHNQHQRTTGSVSSPQSVSEDYRKCLIFTISIRRLKGVSHFHNQHQRTTGSVSSPQSTA